MYRINMYAWVTVCVGKHIYIFICDVIHIYIYVIYMSVYVHTCRYMNRMPVLPIQMFV